MCSAVRKETNSRSADAATCDASEAADCRSQRLLCVAISSSDRNGFTTNLTDGDIKQATGIVRWHVDSGQDPGQAGCPPIWSTERWFYDSRALVDMMHHWYKAVDDRQSVRAVFIDFAKAFDHVDHNILIARLAQFGLPDIIIMWTCSFLRHRRQIGEVMSAWLVMNAGMPQGSYLEPLAFIMLVDSLQASCMTHKYVDDTTLSEIVDKSRTSNMQVYCDELAQQWKQAEMNINSCKTKEMLIGSISKDPPPHLML